ncbi:MAG: 2,3-bisphosphoglycerate-independent phosphoglycerate mutase [Candidatus Doudnabacteria bacterium]|nr:2,3-bisphosphoglycerate-independent phosphoglycerate mutase [Candidatus Doudnabacteria bacterium]
MTNRSQHQRVVLLVLDGWGLSLHEEGNAIARANTPVMDRLVSSEFGTVLSASGESVGLPHGLAGNSEVGHLHLGSGRIVPQDLTRINAAIQDGTFFQNPVFLSALHHARSNGSKLHIMGLLSHGGVHSEASHLYALLEMIRDRGFEKETFLHIFTDGRDTPPRHAQTQLAELQEIMNELGCGHIASVSGRHYAMDRAHNWKRVQKVYDVMVEGKGQTATSAQEAIERAYDQGLDDQHIPPTVITNGGDAPVATLAEDDVVIFFNLRSDRARQLTKPFVLRDFSFFPRKTVLDHVHFVGMTNFGDDLPMSIAFPADPVRNAIPEVLSRRQNLRQLYIAEEEKFAHVSYFFRGGSSIPYDNEERVMVDSLDIESYKAKPDMSSNEVTELVEKAVRSAEGELFVLANYPNADVLGHTGDLEATIQAIEALDVHIGELVKVAEETNTHLIITADHGNAEELIDPETGEVRTQHTTNPVPCILLTPRELPKTLQEGGLINVAPTILDLLGIEPPTEMTATSLVS